jgi:Ca-activated chloride channel family protein
MNRRKLLFSVLVVCLLISSAHAQHCDSAIQRTVLIGALTKEGQPVDNLRADDLLISENKNQLKAITLENRKDQPLAIAVMIDTSASQESSLPGTKLAARAFVQKILRNDKDRAALVSFTSDMIVEQDFTNDQTKLLSAIDRVKIVTPPGYYRGLVIGRPPRHTQKTPGATAIWDAVWSAVDSFKDNAKARRAIVVLTDGDDTNSQRKMRDAVAHAAAANIAIFSIGIAGTYTLDRGNLRDLSDDTGGLAFFPKKTLELDSMFGQITNSLKSRYALSYCSLESSPARKPLKLQISLRNPALVQLSYPRYIL